MEKTDLKKTLKPLYSTGKRDTVPHLVEVPPARYLMADGSGDPNTSERFHVLTGALYAAAYGVKFALKEHGKDFAVMPLEGLWWSSDMDAFREGRKHDWLWTLLIMVPEFVDETAVRSALSSAVERKKLAADVADAVRLEALSEGTAVQALHIGPYDAEAPLIAKMHEHAHAQGYELAGKHHEIYLSDPRRVEPGKLKTILRHPVRAAGS